MNATLEPARMFDAPAVANILSQWVDDTPWMPRIHSHQQDQGFGRWLVEVTEVTVARADGDVVGFLARQDTEIQALYLARSARGHKIGRKLLNVAKRQTERLGLWTFQANLGARRFYNREGFVEKQKTDGRGNDEKLPDIRLIWERSAQ